MERFSRKVSEKLKYYVYLYLDPRTGEPFYIGKGRRNRAFSHMRDQSETEKVQRIKELKKLGQKPRIDILKYGLTEKEALLVEATAIDLIDVKELTNVMRGHGTRHGARGSVEEVAAQLDAGPVEIIEPTMLITIARAYRHDMSPHEVYDATRSAWRVGVRREKAKLAMGVFAGIVREVYEISGWVPGGSTMRVSDRDGRHEDIEGRWEFVGRVADDATRRRYVGKSVAKYFKPGAQNPVQYVNC
jgi:hypothetical protein